MPAAWAHFGGGKLVLEMNWSKIKRFKPDNTFLYLSQIFFFIILIYKILNGINNKYNY